MYFSLFSPFLFSEREASVMILNSWLYHYYTVQSKIQFGLPYDGGTRVPATPPSGGNPTSVYYHHHHIHHHTPTSAFSPTSVVGSPYSGLHHANNHHQYQFFPEQVNAPHLFEFAGLINHMYYSKSLQAFRNYNPHSSEQYYYLIFPQNRVSRMCF